MVGIHWRLPRLGRLRSFRVENIAVDRCADVMALSVAGGLAVGGGLGGGHYFSGMRFVHTFSRRHLLLMLVSVR